MRGPAVNNAMDRLLNSERTYAAALRHLDRCREFAWEHLSDIRLRLCGGAPLHHIDNGVVGGRGDGRGGCQHVWMGLPSDGTRP